MPILFPATPIERLQIASDGCWENSLHISRQLVDHSNLDTWLAGAAQDVAVEAFIPVENGLAFIGVRLTDIPATQQHEFLRALVRDFAGSSDMFAAAFVKRFALSIGCNLFQDIPIALELGKVNAWRSFGPMKFWSRETPLPALAKFKSDLVENSRFAESSALPYAIEFQYAGKLPHWYALPVSRIHNHMHHLDEDLAAQAFTISGV